MSTTRRKSRSAINMNARWLDRLKPPETDRVDYFDDIIHGLGLRVSSTGNKSWFVMYRPQGSRKLKRHTMEPYPQLSLADARERAQALLLDVARGGDPAAEKQVEKGAPTFEDLAREYVERYALREKRSGWRDEVMIKKELLPHWGHRKAHEIQRKDVIKLIDTLHERGLTTQANRILALARKIFNWGISRDMVQLNPCTRVETGIAEKQRDRVLSSKEIVAVWRAFDELGPLMATMFKIQFLTAQRGGEVRSMRWDEIDLAAGWWTIPASVAKNGLSHRVPLTAPVLTLLAEQRQRVDDPVWVFPSPTRKGKHVENIQKAAGRLQEASGVDFVMHDLRRTAASNMTGNGVHRFDVKKILNHVEPGVTGVYDRHSYDPEKRRGLEVWATVLAAMVADGGGMPATAERGSP